MKTQSLQPSALSLGSSDSLLVGALSNYLSQTRCEDDARRAINAWCHNVAHSGLLPERVLIEFKSVLLVLRPGQQSTDPDKRPVDRRQMITMCIEEYFEPTRDGAVHARPEVRPQGASMLSDFVVKNQDEIIRRSRERVATRTAPRPTDDELNHGIPLFVEQLAEQLRAKTGNAAIGASAARHGAILLSRDFTIAQVVHDYGDVCQAITQLAVDQGAPISATDFQQLNLCLDDAIAEAVTEFTRIRERARAQDEAERLGFLAHELRNKINSAMLAFGIIKQGQVAVGGSTGAVLERSLRGLQDLITRSLAEVRVDAGVQHRERVNVRELVEEIEVEGSMTANTRMVHFTVTRVAPNLEVDADRPLLASAIMNLVTNAFKFTAAQGHVWLRTSATKERVFFEVEDQCGGLPVSDSEELFAPWTQRSSDKRGLGLGLPLVRRSVQALGGDVKVTNMPGKGCCFTIGLLRPAPTHPAADKTPVN